MDYLPYADADLEYRDDLNANKDSSKVTIEEIGQDTLDRELRKDSDHRSDMKENNPNATNTKCTDEPKGDYGDQS